jgi:chemotaxis protein CheX
MLGMEMHIVDDTVKDGVAELVNIVAGGAKAKFVQGEGRPIQLSLPTVVRGNSYTVDYPSCSAWLDVPFSSELGPFSLRVTFEMNDEPEGGSR